MFQSEFSITKCKTQCFFWKYQVSAILGVGHATARKLADFGVVTMVDLQQCPLEDLKREIGDSLAVTIKELSEGIDENPVIPYSKPQVHIMLG